MTETDNLVLEHLRAIRADLSLIKSDVRETKTWIGFLEDLYAGLSSAHASLFGLYTNLSGRLDGVVSDIQLIKRRLGLIDA
jgi:hypothetical protein